MFPEDAKRLPDVKLDRGLERINEAERKQKYHFKRDVVEGGGQDEKLLEIIRANTNLSGHFQGAVPTILNGENYKVTAYVSKGKDRSILLAEQEDKSNVLINIIHEEFDDDAVYNSLKEYMFQELAYKAMGGACKTTKPLGFIRRKTGFYDPYNYMMVSQPIVPDSYSVFTFTEALSLHSTKPLCTKSRWMRVCQQLIFAVQSLKKNDLYHNAITPANVLLLVSEKRLISLLIDFSNASRGKTGNTKPMYGPPDQMKPYSVPEHFELPDPLQTSDLHSVTYLILKISQVLQLPVLENYITGYRQQNPQKRDTHGTVSRKVTEIFTEEIKDTRDLTIKDRAPPLKGELDDECK